mmetsp:Transcript_45931/g.55716  ORF Transcript_45931/g.55716 Transcript_45931/m.55716 type:complete len:90 (-) Transcript_45931:276-545(-)
MSEIDVTITVWKQMSSPTVTIAHKYFYSMHIKTPKRTEVTFHCQIETPHNPLCRQNQYTTQLGLSRPCYTKPITNTLCPKLQTLTTDTQ